ncbi:AAA family ATPase [Glycomyces tritici]|uniref:AAA family ATPase n=1 Tax=Glycomyces tritici TaxID=2665176 RepID=A0ABT7YXP1_9ACTN|nr:AAA family ATPase [Glycomyces tritici]MDN3243418.1 AAA family ATPase [Glycomyces tritici]
MVESEQVGVDHAYACFTAMRASTPSLSAFAAASGGPKSGNALVGTGAHQQRSFDLDGQRLVFARVVAPEEDGPRSYYVGRRRVHDDDREAVVVNWESDQGYRWLYARADDREGVLFKRILRCDEHIVTGYTDEFGSDPGAVGMVEGRVPDKEFGWVDPLLAELARGRDSSMRDIIETIQREQLAIVDDQHQGVLVVQGGPGTGKTAVGIPRIARMLGRSGSLLKTDRILVLGPSQEFVKYIAGAFASLGVGDVPRNDLPALWNAREAEHDFGLIAGFKAGPRMAAVLSRAVEDCISNPKVPLARVCKGRNFFSFSFGGSSTEVPAASLFSITAEEMSAEAAYEVRAARCRSRIVGLLHEAFRRDHPRVEEDFSDQIHRMCEQTGLFNAVAPELKPGEVLQRLLASEVVLKRVCSGIATDAELRQLRDRTTRYQRRQWTYEDRVCLQELRYLLQGPDPELTWDHLVIDEAQNVTPMEARELARRCPSGSMTVMGDLAQRLAPYSYFDWQELARTLAPGKAIKVVELCIGFRALPRSWTSRPPWAGSCHRKPPFR